MTTLTLDQAVIESMRSPKFQAWGKPTKGVEKSSLSLAEKHYSPDELASLWGVSVDSIRRIFRDEPGVLKMGDKSPKHKRQYLTLRIPHSIAERVHTRLSE
jgi:hypothetical protein